MGATNEPVRNDGPDSDYAASPEAQAEYDGFGPWMLEVKSLEDMPRRFRDFYPEHAGARFLLKLPRPAERRNLKPGMDLYQTVLAVHEEEVCLLTQAGEQIQVQRGACGAIQAIQVFQHLLHGKLNLFMADGSCFGIGYNASSQGTIDRVAGFLRQRLPEPAAPEPAAPEPAGPEASGARPAVAVEDFCFQSMLADQKRLAPGSWVFHSEASGRSCRDPQGSRRLSLGLLLLATPRELVLVTQGRTARRRKEGAFANEAIYIPWATLRAFDLLPASPERRTWRTIRLGIGAHVWDLDLFEPEKVMALLAHRGLVSPG